VDAAFQADAFQNDAFQTVTVEGVAIDELGNFPVLPTVSTNPYRPIYRYTRIRFLGNTMIANESRRTRGS
jgi:hypothetical protein